jgi:hypothetical protein
LEVPNFQGRFQCVCFALKHRVSGSLSLLRL